MLSRPLFPTTNSFDALWPKLHSYYMNDSLLLDCSEESDVPISNANSPRVASPRVWLSADDLEGDCSHSSEDVCDKALAVMQQFFDDMDAQCHQVSPSASTSAQGRTKLHRRPVPAIRRLKLHVSTLRSALSSPSMSPTGMRNKTRSATAGKMNERALVSPCPWQESCDDLSATAVSSSIRAAMHTVTSLTCGRELSSRSFSSNHAALQNEVCGSRKRKKIEPEQEGQLSQCAVSAADACAATVDMMATIHSNKGSFDSGAINDVIKGSKKRKSRRRKRKKMIQRRRTVWQTTRREEMRACIWEARFMKTSITKLAARYNIPVRTIRRYKEKSLDPERFPCASPDVVSFPNPFPGETVPRPPRKVCDFSKNFTWHAFEAESDK